MNLLRLCQCESDGYCERYNRPMGGRMREICAGVNVDLGTAAAFREQWAREAGTGSLVAPAGSGSSIPLLLKTDQAPGDALAMTAAIYSLHRAFPGRYATAVESYWPEVFEHNPNVETILVPNGTDNWQVLGGHDVHMHYPAIHQSNDRAIHFMQGWCEFLGAALNVSVPLMTNRPHLYFDTPAPPVENFWLVCSGGKRDFTTKLWGHERYQCVVDLLRGKVSFVQVGGAKPIVSWRADQAVAHQDYHQPLDGVEDMLGRTTLRQLFDLARRARGILCGVSLLMHVAAALEKPAVVVAGGREPVPWNAYPRQQYVHTVGALPCHDARGRTGVACWRYRTRPLGDSEVLDRNTCERPDGDVPRCMSMISPEEVAALVLRYNGQYDTA